MKKTTVIKRNGDKAEFDTSKIERAIRRANGDVDNSDTLSDGRIRLIAEEVETFLSGKDSVSAGDVQDCVETKLIELGSANLARTYITYRYRRIIERQNSERLVNKIRTFFTRLAAWICPL